MCNGKQIINLCNITSNRVPKDIAGFAMSYAASDSFIQIWLNNQSVSSIFALNYHYALPNKQISVLSCNHIENKDSNEGNLIVAYKNTDLYMFGCCIARNEVKYVIYNNGRSVVVNNSYTDSYQTLNPVEFTNTISSSECKYYTFEFINNANKEDNDDDDSFFIKKVKQNVRYLDNRPKIIYFVLK